MSIGPLTDRALQRALVELTDGPDAGRLAADVAASIENTAQLRARPWASLSNRQMAMIGAGALLAVTLLGTLLAAGFRSPEPVQLRQPGLVLVLQHWNGLVGAESAIVHTAIDPGTGRGGPLGSAPQNAMNLHWAGDGSRVAYLGADASVRDGLGGTMSRLQITGFFVANGDWSAAGAVDLQGPLTDYAFGDLGDGVMWSPTGTRFAVARSTGMCETGPDCLPETDLDVFAAGGRYLTTLSVPEGELGIAGWTADGRALGWYTGSCPAGSCATDAYHWRTVDGAGLTVDIRIARIGGVLWLGDGRLAAYTSAPGNGGIDRVITMQPDGSDVRDLVPAGSHPWFAGLSRDGKRIASLDWRAGTLTIDDVATRTRTDVAVGPGMSFGGWSPDGQWILLLTDSRMNPSARTFHIAGMDGSPPRELGEGENYTWAPAAVAVR